MAWVQYGCPAQPVRIVRQHAARQRNVLLYVVRPIQAARLSPGWDASTACSTNRCRFFGFSSTEPNGWKGERNWTIAAKLSEVHLRAPQSQSAYNRWPVAMLLSACRAAQCRGGQFVRTRSGTSSDRSRPISLCGLRVANELLVSASPPFWRGDGLRCVLRGT
jgi:hypothetical protein